MESFLPEDLQVPLVRETPSVNPASLRPLRFAGIAGGHISGRIISHCKPVLVSTTVPSFI